MATQRLRKDLLAAGIFILCIAPTIISYSPYSLRWDDAEYLTRSVSANQALWSGDIHAFGSAVYGPRPLIMALMGLPWGPMKSWASAGWCFVTLNGLTSFFAASALYLMLRIGVRLSLLPIAGLCVFAAIGPFSSRTDSSGFMVDSLLSWAATAAVLLIPYEAASLDDSRFGGLLHGLAWALVLGIGALTKVNFLYFDALVIPILIATRIRLVGFRRAIPRIAAFGIFSVPFAVCWLHYGRGWLGYGLGSSFGASSALYLNQLDLFFRNTVNDCPGILVWALFVALAIVFWLLRYRVADSRLFPVAVMAGYATIALVSTNRELRFLLPVVVGVPFALGLLLSDATWAMSRSHAALAALVAFLGLTAAGVPMNGRLDRQSIRKSEAVLAEAQRLGAKKVMLATDGATLNLNLMHLTLLTSPPSPDLHVQNLADRAIHHTPIEQDFREIRDSDLIVFQDIGPSDPPFTNQRVPDYERYAREFAVGPPISVASDVRIYAMNPPPK